MVPPEQPVLQLAQATGGPRSGVAARAGSKSIPQSMAGRYSERLTGQHSSLRSGCRAPHEMTSLALLRERWKGSGNPQLARLAGSVGTLFPARRRPKTIRRDRPSQRKKSNPPKASSRLPRRCRHATNERVEDSGMSCSWPWSYSGLNPQIYRLYPAQKSALIALRSFKKLQQAWLPSVKAIRNVACSK